MTSTETELKKLGLNEREIQVYLTLLTHGPSSVRKIAGISGINRGTTYEHLRTLRERGLVCFYHEDMKQCFVAEDPAKLHQLLNDRRSELDRSKESLDRLVPELRALHNSGGEKPVSRFYEGPEGVRAILLDVLATMEAADPKEYFVYSSASVRDAGLYASFEDYTNERITRGIRVNTIALGPGGTTAGLDERKWIPAVEGTPTYILIYGGKVAHISLGNMGKLFGVIIENPGVYQTQKLIFQEMWKQLG